MGIDFKKIFNKKRDEESDEILDDDVEIDELEEGDKPKKSLTPGSKKKLILIGGGVVVLALFASFPVIAPLFMGNSVDDLLDSSKSSSVASNHLITPPIKQPKRVNKIKPKVRKIKKDDKLDIFSKNIEDSKPKKIVENDKKIESVISNPHKVKKTIKEDQPILQKIEETLPNDRLSGKKDPIALVDEKVIENRAYSEFLNQKLQNMSKLIEYYKKKKELEDILEMYKRGYGNKRNKNDELKEMLTSTILPLKRELNSLKSKINELESISKSGEDVKVVSGGSDEDFKKFTQRFDDLLIYTKNGRYIAVLRTPRGDKIIKEGDTFNGYKIKKITDDVITFEKNGRIYYYNYSPMLNNEYQVAQIGIPASVKSGGYKTSKISTRSNIKEYTPPPSERELIRRQLDERLKRLSRKRK